MNRQRVLPWSQLRALRLAGLLLFLSWLLVSAAQEQSWLYGGGGFTPSDSVRLEYYLSGGVATPLTLARVLNPEKLLAWGGPQNFGGTQELELARIRSLSLTPRNGHWGTLELGRLDAGVYFAQLGSGSDAAATLILVTDLSLVVKSDQDTVLAYTAQSSSGTPRQAQIYLMQGPMLYAEGLASDEGLTEFTTPTDRGDLMVAAKYGNDWAFSDSTWYRWGLRRASVYIQTDRPVYRPSHTVYFKGTARSPAGLSPLLDAQVRVVVRAADNTEVLRQAFVTDAYGSFGGELRLGIEPPLGLYTIEVTAGGDTHHGTFEVQAYQKPEYRVTVTPDETVAVQGDTARVTIKGEYLFGGPVSSGVVTYAVLKQPYYRFQYRSHYGFYADYDDSPYDYGGEMVTRGEGVLDEHGELTLELLLPGDDQDYRLTVQAGVTDEARREISATGSLVVYRAGVVVNVETDRYAYRAGEQVSVTVRAEDLQGRPVSVPFELRSERHYWLRGAGARTEGGRTYRGQTGADGTASLTLDPNEQGSYTLILTAQDAEARETTASGHLWVSDGSTWHWAYEGLSVRADKPEYEVGDTARFVIQSPVPDAHVLVTLEGQDLASYDLVKLDGSVLTLELPVTQAMTPNGYLSVVIVGNGRTYLETVGFRVPPADKFLNVEISSDSDTYRPGDTGTFRLRVSDARGAGVRAQLTLGLVDEAIYLVRPERTPDIRGFFYALRDNLVGTQLSSWYYFGQAVPMAAEAPARGAMDEAVFAQAKSDFAQAEVREDFRDTILWLPTLETGWDGLATAQVTFPDNLTAWRLTARAITLGDEVGQDTTSVTTTLPVITRLAAPRYLIRGDDASLRVIAQSNLKTTEAGRLELTAEGLTLLNPEPRDVTLSPGSRTAAEFRVQAEATGTAMLQAGALTSVFSDAMRLPLLVLPHGIREEVGWADAGSGSWSFALPAKVELGSTHGTLYLTPSLVAAVAPALSYLAGYPYGCTEQTMSRFLPSVLAAQAGELAQLPEDIAGNLDDIVAVGLKRINDFQHDDGGWGFWQHDASSPFISAYVVSGLLDARDAGYRVQDPVLERGLSYLEQVVRAASFGDDRVVDADGKAYAFYALARAGRTIDGLGKAVGRADMSAYGLALSVLAFHTAGRDVEANLYLDELMSRITERASVAYWESGAPRYFWNDDRVEATAYGLEALARLRPDEPRLGKIVNWLLLERKGARWVSTKDTAAVVKASLALAEATGEVTADYEVAVVLNGRTLEARRMQGRGTNSIAIPLTGLRAGRNRLELSVTGDSTLYASASVSFVAERDYSEPEANGFIVTRRYESLVPAYFEDEGRHGYARFPVNGGHKVGDYVLVSVTLDPGDAYRYVLVNEPVPAGYRVIENDLAFRIAGLEGRYGRDYYGWNYWYDGREVRDERVDYYFSYLNGPVTFTYLLRAETPGTFTALPTQAWLMYEPDVKGTGTQAVLAVFGDE